MGMAVFSLGWGATPWVYPSEIFSMETKEKALSTSVASQWIANFVIAFMVPLQVKALGTSGTFLFYTVCLVIGTALVFFFVPETKGVAFEDMASADNPTASLRASHSSS